MILVCRRPGRQAPHGRRSPSRVAMSVIREDGPGGDGPRPGLGERRQARREIHPVPGIPDDATTLDPRHHDVAEDTGGIEPGPRSMGERYSQGRKSPTSLLCFARPIPQRPAAVRRGTGPHQPQAEAPAPDARVPGVLQRFPLPAPGPLPAAGWAAVAGARACLAVKVIGEPDRGKPLRPV